MTAFAPDTTFGKYRIIRLLGKGGMADVYEAEDTAVGRVVALKILPLAFARDEERARRFAKEIQASAALDHPNIVSVFEVGEVEGLHYYTMSVLPGGDLKDRIRNGVVDQAEAVRITREIASALNYAHEKGFVHRDVKPENILFREDGGAVLTDFGIAKAIVSGTRMTATGLSIGTPHYMSPEQARGAAVEGRSDLYALGVVFHEMLTGRVPFEAQDSLAVAYQHVNDPVPAMPAGLEIYQPIIDLLLAKQPQDRYTDGRALLDDLDAVVRADQERDLIAAASASMRTVAKSEKGKSTASTLSGAGKAWIWGLAGAVGAACVSFGLYMHLSLQAPERNPGAGSVTPRGGSSAAWKAPAHATDKELEGPLVTGSRTPVEDTVQYQAGQDAPLARSRERPNTTERSEHGAQSVLPWAGGVVEAKPKSMRGNAFYDADSEDGAQAGALSEQGPIAAGSPNETNAGPEPKGALLPAIGPVRHLPRGEFVMGSDAKDPVPEALPRRPVAITRELSIQAFNVTVRQFDAFVKASGYVTDAERSTGCRIRTGQGWTVDTGANWRRPGYPAKPTHPVTCVSWNDAREYADWAQMETKQNWRLPSESEWEYAAQMLNAQLVCDVAKLPPEAQEARRDFCASSSHSVQEAHGEARDTDFLGSVWQWTSDCVEESYESIELSQNPWAHGECDSRVLRGGAWSTNEIRYISDYSRTWFDKGGSSSDVGFRLIADTNVRR